MTRRLASRVVVSVGLTLDRNVIAVEGEVGGLAEPVRARRLTDQEGRKLQQIVRRGRHESVRVRRALIIMASASGTTVPAIARLVAAHEDTVRDVIHAFNERGLAALDPQSSFSTVCVSGDGCSAMAGPAGQSMPSMMRKSRSTPSGRATSAF